MTKATLALIALAAFALTGCTTNTLYNHRKDFTPAEGKGPWTTELKKHKDGTRYTGKNGGRPVWKDNRPWREVPWK